MSRRTRSDDGWDFPYFGGNGSLHDLRDAPDGLNPRLAGLRSVSYAAALAMGSRDQPNTTKPGFHIPKGRTR